MKHRLIYISFVFMALMLMGACSTVPLTGRKQLDIIPASTMLAMRY